MTPRPYINALVLKRATTGGGGVKKCPKSYDVIHEKPLNIFVNVKLLSSKFNGPETCLNPDFLVTQSKNDFKKLPSHDCPLLYM